MRKLWDNYCWLIVGIANVLVALLIGRGVSGWSNDISTIGGYTFLTMFLVGGSELVAWWNKHEWLPAAVITGGVAGTVLTLLLF